MTILPPPIDFAGLALRPTPNQYLVAPEGLCRTARPHALAPSFAAAPDALRVAFRQIALAQLRVTFLRGDDGLLQDDYVQRSPLLGFPDYVTFRALATANGRSTFAFYSRSVYGYSDLGVNRRRGETWLAALATAVPG